MPKPFGVVWHSLVSSAAMIGRAIGHGFAVARDFIARGLLKLGVRPNTLTLTGMVVTGLAGVAYAIGAGRRFAWSLDPSLRFGRLVSTMAAVTRRVNGTLATLSHCLRTTAGSPIPACWS